MLGASQGSVLSSRQQGAPTRHSQFGTTRCSLCVLCLRAPACCFRRAGPQPTGRAQFAYITPKGVCARTGVAEGQAERAAARVEGRAGCRGCGCRCRQPARHPTTDASKQSAGSWWSGRGEMAVLQGRAATTSARATERHARPARALPIVCSWGCFKAALPCNSGFDVWVGSANWMVVAPWVCWLR